MPPGTCRPDSRLSETWQPMSVSRKNLLDELMIRQTNASAYDRLKHLHYISEGLPLVNRKIFGLYAEGVLYGVIVYSLPNLESSARNRTPLGLYLLTMPKPVRYTALNQLVSVISRIVLHPSLRGVGAASHLIEQTWRLAGTKYVEIIAQMLYYHNFLPASCSYYTRVEKHLRKQEFFVDSRHAHMPARLKRPVMRYGYGLFMR